MPSCKTRDRCRASFALHNETIVVTVHAYRKGSKCTSCTAVRRHCCNVILVFTVGCHYGVGFAVVTPMWSSCLPLHYLMHHCGANVQQWDFHVVPMHCCGDRYPIAVPVCQIQIHAILLYFLSEYTDKDQKSVLITCIKNFV